MGSIAWAIAKGQGPQGWAGFNASISQQVLSTQPGCAEKNDYCGLLFACCAPRGKAARLRAILRGWWVWVAARRTRDLSQAGLGATAAAGMAAEIVAAVDRTVAWADEAAADEAAIESPPAGRARQSFCSRLGQRSPQQAQLAVGETVILLTPPFHAY